MRHHAMPPRWPRGRAHFARRMGCMFAVMLFLSAVGATALLSMLLGRVSLWPPVLLLIAAFLTAAFFMRRFALPLGAIVDAADRVGSGDYSPRVAERGVGRLRSVARAFNDMAEHLAANEQRRRHLMADIAHELRTPLAVIQGELEGLIDGVYPRDDDRLRQLLDETRVVSRLVEDLRTLANSESGALTLRKEPTDLAVLIHDAASAFPVTVDVPPDLPLIDVDPLRIREVIVNLLSNAVRHGSVVTIVARITGGQAVVSVTDNGSGIPADELPKIFDRFYKGAASQGSGLGLTIARNLVVAHGGEIRAESEAGRGTTITFTLPA